LVETLNWMLERDHQFVSNDPIVLARTETDLREVPVTGASFLLVKRQVFEAIEPPWFQGDVNGFGEDFDQVTEFVKKEYHSPTWSCENYSIYPRPDVIAPNIEGLYFVGDSVDGDGVGGDIATGTGTRCADLILSGK